MKRTCILVLAVLIIVCMFFAVKTAYAGGGNVGGATEATQVLNHAELMRQVTQLETQIRNMVYNTNRLQNQVFLPVSQIYLDIMNIMNSTRGLAFHVANYADELRNSFPSFANAQDILRQGGLGTHQEQLRNIVYTQRETVISSLEALGLSGAQIESDAQILGNLQDIASTAEGRNQILQAANQFAAMQTAQIMEIRQALITYATMMGVIQESERAQSDANQANWERMTENPMPSRLSRPFASEQGIIW